MLTILTYMCVGLITSASAGITLIKHGFFGNFFLYVMPYEFNFARKFSKQTEA